MTETTSPAVTFDLPESWEVVESTPDALQIAGPPAGPGGFPPVLSILFADAVTADGVELSLPELLVAQIEQYELSLTDFTRIDEGFDPVKDHPVATVAYRQGQFTLTGRLHVLRVADWITVLFGASDTELTPLLLDVFDGIARSVREDAA